MKDLNKLMKEITMLTTNIETNYPELYRYIDENPITIASSDDPEVDMKAMKEYLESLKDQLKSLIESHKETNRN